MRFLRAGIFVVVALAAIAGSFTIIGVALSLLSGIPNQVEAMLDTPASSPDRIPNRDRIGGSSGSAVRFTIERGERASNIGARLERMGLVRSGLAFRLMAQWKGVDDKLEAGEYELRPTMKMSEILNTLQTGRSKGIVFTIPEGWRAAEIADALEQRLGLNRPAFLKEFAEGAFDFDFLRDRPSGASLEGYLFPDTYEVSTISSPREIVKIMLENFGKRLTSQMREEALRAGMTVHQVVTLASIVEREAKVASERPVIASVFLNRLKASMPLEADPTVQYALIGPDPDNPPPNGYWKKEISREDTQLDMPYNTYRYPGLPPGPIANPGLESIMAVLEPAKTNYLYFVANGDGNHAFAATYDEHLANERRYRR